MVLFSLLPLWVAFGFFRLGVATWFGHPYYLGNDHLERGCLWLLVGLAALLPGSYCAVSRRASTGWLAVGFAAALFAAVALPSNVLPGMLMPRAEGTLTAKARGLANALETWDGNQGQLPAREKDLLEIATKAEGPNGLMGPYYRDGVLAPVQIIYVGRANGPVLDEPVHAAMPAAMYCAVSADRQRFWITVTMLDREVGGHPRWLKALGGTQPLVINGLVSSESQNASKMRGAGSLR